MPSALEYSRNAASKLSSNSVRCWLSTYIPLIFANAPNLAGKCTNLCVDCKGIYRMELTELSLVLVYIELPDRFGYLALYNSATKALLYLCYCGEITLTLAVKSMFDEHISGSALKNICMVAPIDCVITAEEPYKSEWSNFSHTLNLSSFSYVYLDGSILKCKRIGRQGRDLQVVDKFYVTNKIPELNKALSHEPTCLINGKLLVDGLSDSDDVAQRITDRLNGTKLPVARMGMSTALSDTENDADIVVALALTPENNAICATLSNDWLKRAVKHKLNKFPPEFTSDNKYEVQQLTTEATIKYQGDTWKGAEKSDLIYVIVERASRRPVSIISIGKAEFDYIKLRRHMVKSAIKDQRPYIEHINVDFETAGLDKLLMFACLQDMQNELCGKDRLSKFATDNPNAKVSWIDMLNEEVKMAVRGPAAGITFAGMLFDYRRLNTSSRTELVERKVYMDDLGTDTPGRLSATLRPKSTLAFTISRHYEPAKPHSFNLPTITITVPDHNGNRQTYEGKVKFGIALMKNVENPQDNFMTFVEKAHHAGVGQSKYNSFSLCDYLFPTMPLHENSTYDSKYEHGYQLVVSNAIYGKKLKDAAKFMYAETNNTEAGLITVAKMTSTGYEVQGSSLGSTLSLGYFPDTYEEYCELIQIDDRFESLTTKHKTVMYTTAAIDDESILDDMDDDDYSDLLDDGFDDSDDDLDVDYDDGFDDGTGQTAEDDDSILSDEDAAFYEDDEDDAWQMQRMLWLQNHPNSDCITDNGEKVYWFDIMHDMMKADQPDNANNIQLLETIWNSMLSKMQGYTAQDVMSMMYEQLKPSDDTSTGGEADSSDASDLTDDDDELFADL